jgi:uncharacterized protein YegJ (DUF2314 family)
MKKVLVIFLMALVFILTGCRLLLTGDDPVIGVDSEDQEMNLIIEEARGSVNQFLEELDNPHTAGYGFSVKYPFDTDPGSRYEVEHIWLENIQTINEKYSGIVVNDPYYIKTMKYGDTVEFDINSISDWKYIENGYLVGGKSIVYFYNRMSEYEKKNFEKQAGFKIKE